MEQVNNMAEKRWEIIDEEFISYTGGTAQLISNGECKIHLWETPKDAQLFCDKLNDLNEENENLKKALWEAETEYIHERYFDNPIREEESINELKEDFKRGYWND